MSTDTRSAEEIEKDIEAHREGLSDTLNEVQDRFSVERLARQMTDQFSEHGGDIGRSVSDSMKKNPLAVAVTGIGLAWLIFGNGRAQPDLTKSGDNSGHASSATSGHSQSPEAQSPMSGGLPRYPRPASIPRRDDRGLPVWAKSSGRAVAAPSGMQGAVSDPSYAPDGNTPHSGLDAPDTMTNHQKSSAQSAGERAKDMRDQLSHGTEKMSDAARDRIVAAREQAMNAYDNMSDKVHSKSSQLADYYEDQPLVIGALGLAIGAAIGALASRTEFEDDAMGAQRDQLFAEAERIYDEEKAKLGSVVEEIAKEAQSQSDTLSDNNDRDTVASTVDRVKSSMTRIAETAHDEAQDQKVGKTSI